MPNPDILMAKPKKMKILDLGCGTNKYKSENSEDIVIGMDRVGLKGVDAVHDANIVPYPFKDNEFDIIISTFGFEHFDDLITILEECHRILKFDGIIKVKVPHCSCISGAYGDITHKHYFSYFSFRNAIDPKGNTPWEISKKFEVIKEKIIFGRFFKPIEIFANKFPKIYENFLAWTFPARDLYFEIRVIKNKK